MPIYIGEGALFKNIDIVNEVLRAYQQGDENLGVQVDPT